MELEIEVNPIYQKTEDALNNPNIRVIAHEGGTRSGKTYNIIYCLIIWAIQHECEIDIIAPTFPHLRMGAMKDFFDILNKHELYNYKCHNKSANTYRLHNSLIRLFSLDVEGKAKGPTRDIIFINEVDLVKQEIYRQLKMRTKSKIIIDYNPAYGEGEHWVYNEVDTGENVELIKSTYLDNIGFLPSEQVKDIEGMINVDERLYRIYTLGERTGILEGLYFPDIKVCVYEEIQKGYELAGLDFGYEVPTALIGVKIVENNCYLKELIYEKQMTNADLIARLGNDKKLEIIADSEDPQRIEEIYRKGYNIRGAEKGKGSVQAGIDSMKRFNLFIDRNSHNLRKEFRTYVKKKDKDGNYLDEPVKFLDHGIDASRYAINYYVKKFFTTSQPKWRGIKARR